MLTSVALAFIHLEVPNVLGYTELILQIRDDQICTLLVKTTHTHNPTEQ